MTIAILITVGVLIVGLIVVLQRRSSGSDPSSRPEGPHETTPPGTHQGRSPGADGGGHSYYNGGG